MQASSCSWACVWRRGAGARGHGARCTLHARCAAPRSRSKATATAPACACLPFIPSFTKPPPATALALAPWPWGLGLWALVSISVSGRPLRRRRRHRPKVANWRALHPSHNSATKPPSWGAKNSQRGSVFVYLFEHRTASILILILKILAILVAVARPMTPARTHMRTCDHVMYVIHDTCTCDVLVSREQMSRPN